MLAGVVLCSAIVGVILWASRKTSDPPATALLSIDEVFVREWQEAQANWETAMGDFESAPDVWQTAKVELLNQERIRLALNLASHVSARCRAQEAS